jgi:hypothetical protein
MQLDYEEYRAEQFRDGQTFQDFVVDLAWPFPFPRRPRFARLRLRTTPESRRRPAVAFLLWNVSKDLDGCCNAWEVASRFEATAV